MADYIFTTVSNCFRTKDNQEVARVFEDLGFEETYVTPNNDVFVGSYGEGAWSDDTYVVKNKEGKVVGAYEAYNSQYGDMLELVSGKLDIPYEEVNEEDYHEISLEAYIQDMLLDNQAFILQETGHEKLRYNVGSAIIITKDDVKFFDIGCLVRDYLESKGIKE